jgi:hypothetical protein
MRKALLTATGLALSAGLVALSPVGPGAGVPASATSSPSGAITSASPSKHVFLISQEIDTFDDVFGQY